MEYFIFMVWENIYFPKQFLFTMQEKTWLFRNIRSEVFCLLNNIIRQVETKPWNRNQILVRYD